jgi:hypothetical protein
VLDLKLPKILTGEVLPADAVERVALLELCVLRRFYAAAARFFSEAFAADPNLSNPPGSGNRYDAACAAALAGCGQGLDAAHLDAKEYARLREQALGWLRAELADYRSMVAKQPAKAQLAARTMEHWQRDTDFDGVRSATALAKLPEAERQEWQKLWQDVEELKRQAEEANSAVKAAGESRAPLAGNAHRP